MLRLSDGTTESAVSALAVGAVITEGACFVLALIEYMFDRRIYGGISNKGYAIGEVAGMALPLAFSTYVRSFLMSVEHSLIPRRLTDTGASRSEALSSYGYLSGMALPIILFPMTPLSSFSGLLVPEFAECEGAGNISRMERIASRAVEITMLYATAASVFIFAFSEEIGYVIYDTYEAGRYVAFLAPVIPIMYLDHVTDSMLKGIGEHVFSMWVNIIDSLLSVALVWLLIPIFDISGYAIVIILMELFNFTLSFLRLRKRVRFKVSVFSSAGVAVLFSGASVLIAKRAFGIAGSGVGVGLFVSEMVVSVCIFTAFMCLKDILIFGTKRKKETVKG